MHFLNFMNHRNTLLGYVNTAQAATFLVAILGLVGNAMAKPLLIASTTSTEQSGLFAYLLPAFKRATGIDAKVLALGTGQALDTARRGDADVLLVHDPLAEEAFVAQGYGLRRVNVMYSDFVLLGPKSDPAQIKSLSAEQALIKIAQARRTFVSRADKSGTHSAELALRATAGAAHLPSAGYKACGCSMGAALNMAASLGAYVLADRGTWLNFKNPRDLVLLVGGGVALHNPYSAIALNPAMHPHLQHGAARQWIDWLTSPQGQGLIGNYSVQGQRVFAPNADKSPATK